MRVLVVEDDRPLASFVQRGLEAEAYTVDHVEDTEEAKAQAMSSNYDLMILDLNLPSGDGVEVLQTLREKQSEVPVLILTARNRVEDRVRCLDLGADDCLIKPFSYSELSARVRALLRRQNRSSESLLRYEDLELKRVERVVTRGDRVIELTPKEFALLEYLMIHCGQPVTRTMIIENVWHLNFDTMTNIVDVYINYLRRKIDGPNERKLIQTIRGKGYQLGTAVSLNNGNERADA